MKENRYSSLSLGRFIAESNGISKEVQDILEASWRPSTRKRYAGHVQRFTQYCHQRNVDPFQETSKTGIEYLTKTLPHLFYPYTQTENEIPYVELPLVYRFLKGVFNLKPAYPGYSTTWDVSVVLKYIKTLKALKQWDLKSLPYRLAILLCIATGQRDQTLFFVLYKHRLNDVRGRQGINFCSGVIATITSRTSSGPNGAFNIPRSGNLCCRSS